MNYHLNPNINEFFQLTLYLLSGVFQKKSGLNFNISPLPEGIECYSLGAAILAAKNSRFMRAMLATEISLGHSASQA